MTKFAQIVTEGSQGAGQEVTADYLGGPDGWNERQGNALDGIPVVFLGGDYFSRAGVAEVWPNDGLVTIGSALAANVSSTVLSGRVTRTFPDVHSIYFTHLLELPMERGLTWDPDVLDAVVYSVANSGQVD